MYAVASADTVISSKAGGFQTYRLGRGTKVFRAMAVTSFPADFVGGFRRIHVAATWIRGRRLRRYSGSANANRAAPWGAPSIMGANPSTQPPHPLGTAMYCIPPTL